MDTFQCPCAPSITVIPRSDSDFPRKRPDYRPVILRDTDAEILNEQGATCAQ